MTAPNSEYPVSLRPGQSQLQQPYNSQFQQPNTGRALDHSVHTSTTHSYSSYDDQSSSSNMSSAQQLDQGNYNPRYPSGQMPGYNNQGESSASGAIGADDAPRMRSSQFGAPYANSNTQPPVMPNSQQHIFAQHSGSSGAQSSAQAGPSNPRPFSYMQPAPLASVIHGSGSPQPGASPPPRPSTSSKSPFTTPITSPPRTRPNQILLVNPTSTTALTTLLTNTLRPILPNALELTAYNAPYPAPTAIESTVDTLLSSETVLRDLAKYSTNDGETIQNFDALLIASYSKHPLIDALRESYDVPVVGIMEASLYVARMLGGRFGIISTSTRTKLQIDDAVAAYGLSHFFVGVESLHINPLELLSPNFIATNSADGSTQPSTPSTITRSKEELNKRLTTQSKALVAKGADTIILGSEFLTSNEAIRIIKDAVRDEDGRRTVNIVDSVEAGVMMLNGLVGMGVPTSKKGIYRGERDGRRGRGQTWL